jgi:hypothetical protein
LPLYFLEFYSGTIKGEEGESNINSPSNFQQNF